MRKKMMTVRQPDRVWSYFKTETGILTIISISGIIYNVGMAAGPWFEGQLVQRLVDILGGRKLPATMVSLALLYMIVIACVQGSRAVKRYGVRIFANDVSRSMRHVLYHSLVNMDTKQLAAENTGSLMTKAIADVDACAEGMRKVTTEIFDTGVVMVVYLAMLLSLDWRLTILALLFTPPAYIIADRLKKKVASANSAYKKSASVLNQMTLDRISNAVTYRLFGGEDNRNRAYEAQLEDYAGKSARANIFEGSLAPLYDGIAMIGAVMILYFGAKNVAGTGWTAWNIASFTTYLACFTKLATKTSHAAKLFNAVQKAQVSWKRIKPLMEEAAEEDEDSTEDKNNAVITNIDKKKTSQLKKTEKNTAGRKPEENNEEKNFVKKNYAKENSLFVGKGQPLAGKGQPLVFSHVSCSYDGGNGLSDISFSADPGQIIGITGMVASGKSMLGKTFIGLVPWQGQIAIGGREMQSLTKKEKRSAVSYMGHEPELLSTTIEENVTLGDEIDCEKWLKAVMLWDEVQQMPEKEKTLIGMGGSQLSGGQQARLALARTLSHSGAVLVLDDPLAAVDRKTEAQILTHIRQLMPDRVILLISHRLYHFPQLDHVLFLHDGKGDFGSHEEIMKRQPEYTALYEKQQIAGDLDEEADSLKSICLSERNPVNKEWPNGHPANGIHSSGLMKAGKQTVEESAAGKQTVEEQTSGKQIVEEPTFGKQLAGKQKVLSVKSPVWDSVKNSLHKHRGAAALMILCITGSVITALLPPLVLEKGVDLISAKKQISLTLAIVYLLLIFVSDVFESAQGASITILGQKITQGLRQSLCEKLNHLPTQYFKSHDSGMTASVFVNDADTIDSLYSDGIVGMIADSFKINSILIVVFTKSIGLGFLLLLVTPFLFWVTRVFQKRTLKAQTDNRKAIAKVNNHVPETIRNIRMIHVFSKEKYMEDKYDGAISESYDAVNRSNIYDSIYSPIILLTQSLIIAVMMTGAAGDGNLRQLFGLTAGSAVAVIAYVGKIFSPLESLGMEIQNIQSAMSGIKRINEFLLEEEWNPAEEQKLLSAAKQNPVEEQKLPSAEKQNPVEEQKLPSAEKQNPAEEQKLPSAAKWNPAENQQKDKDFSVKGIRDDTDKHQPCNITFSHVTFGYTADKDVLKDISFEIKEGENVTFMGRTGSGKSTIFNLLTGLYEPGSGQILVAGCRPSCIKASDRRKLYGIVEQKFTAVPGTIADQLSLYDSSVTGQMMEDALKLTGLWAAIQELPVQTKTGFTDAGLSQGQLQLLAIARAIVTSPRILLLDEITANLDSETEAKVLAALKNAAEGRTVLSISHRYSEVMKDERIITVGDRW